MYIKKIVLENAGPIRQFELETTLLANGSPKPIIFVGKNGSGKTILISQLADALVEFAKTAFRDVAQPTADGSSPYFKLSGHTNITVGQKYGVSVCLFECDGKEVFYYDKAGLIEHSEFIKRHNDLKEKFPPWPKEENNKAVSQEKKLVEKEFLSGVYCYFAASRKETPNWLNREAFGKNPQYSLDLKISGRLGKSIFIESSAEDNKQWLLDVIHDQKIDAVTLLDIKKDIGNLLKNASGPLTFNKTLQNVNTILRHTLQDDEVHFGYLSRQYSANRLCILKNGNIHVPSLDHLSSGEATLFNMFCTIIRYADRPYAERAFVLKEIEGIVLIDEADAHLHSEVLYDRLPKLLSLFPKIQFFISTHSPLFLLGIESEFGSDNVDIIELPNGTRIGTERFSEFQSSFEFFKNTERFEDEIKETALKKEKPIILTEGETDPRYIKAALELLERNDLLDRVEVNWVGSRGSDIGKNFNTGIKGLDHTWNVLLANPEFCNRRVLCLYDPDSNKPIEMVGNLERLSFKKNEKNKKVKKGIENLFPEKLFKKKFYPSKKIVSDLGEEKIITQFDKMGFCSWVCDERKNPDDFKGFAEIIVIIERLVGREK